MTFRSYLLLFTLLIGTYAMAQVDTPDVRLVPVLGEPAVIDVATPQEPDSTQALIMVEVMPEFPGGMPALSQYVTGELRYPKEARQRNIEGLVLVGFVVERDGSISQSNVLRGIGGGCDEEALRVVARMPAWKPGQQGGTPVRVRYTLPLRFKLVGEKSAGGPRGSSAPPLHPLLHPVHQVIGRIGCMRSLSAMPTRVLP